MARLFWLSEQSWTVLERHLPHDRPGRPRVDDRRVISGILHVLKSGCRWCDCPPEYGPPTTIYNRFNRWRKAGVWDRLMDAITKAYDGDVQMIDTSVVRVHQQGATGKRGVEIAVSVAREVGSPRKSTPSSMRRGVRSSSS